MLRERMDLSRRAQPAELAEWMDEPCSYEEFRACLLDLAQVNRVSLGYRPTLRWLDRLIANGRERKALHIVDVGCGAGDTLLRIQAWARERNVAVSLMGIDLNPHAIRAATELNPRDSEIVWVCGDAYSVTLSPDIDVVVSSLVTHHMSDVEIVHFLRWMEAHAQRGWFINDLERCRFNFYGFQLLAKAARWHRFVQHDGPVSFRRSFRKPDWRRLCVEAGLPFAALQIERHFPGRLCVGRIK